MRTPVAGRNQAIRARFMAGEPMQAIADDHGISRQRVEQIIRPGRVRARSQANRTTSLDGQRCGMCGDRATQRHHPDYGTPDIIVFVCDPCHVTADRDRHREQARLTLGLRPGATVENLTEASARLGLLYTACWEAAEGGAVASARIAQHTFVPSGEMDAWAAFVAARLSARASASGPTYCNQGHLIVAWNVTDGRCRACGAENQRQFHGRTEPDLSQYDICKTLHDMGFQLDVVRQNHIEGLHPNGAAIILSRWSNDPWKLRRRHSSSEIGRAADLDTLRWLIFENIGQSKGDA